MGFLNQVFSSHIYRKINGRDQMNQKILVNKLSITLKAPQATFFDNKALMLLFRLIENLFTKVF